MLRETLLVSNSFSLNFLSKRAYVPRPRHACSHETSSVVHYCTRWCFPEPVERVTFMVCVGMLRETLDIAPAYYQLASRTIGLVEISPDLFLRQTN